MNVLFLDIDGVLNSERWLTRHIDTRNVPLWVQYLDPEAVARLNAIVERTHARVVISSTWRKGMTVTTIAGLLHAVGFKQPDRIVGKTDDLSQCVCAPISPARGHEIQFWVAQHPEVTSIVVLDDSSDMDGVQHRWVRCDDEVGLTDANVEEAVKLFEAT